MGVDEKPCNFDIPEKLAGELEKFLEKRGRVKKRMGAAAMFAAMRLKTQELDGWIDDMDEWLGVDDGEQSGKPQTLRSESQAEAGQQT